MATWSLTAEVSMAEAEDVAVRFLEHGASGVEERSTSIIPLPGVPQPTAGRALLVAWFTERADAEAAATHLAGGALAEVADRDWGEEWKKGLGAFSVGPVFVRPSWVEARVPAGAVEVVLDPGMAFGTGTHPTTSLCLAALAEMAAARPGLSLLDVGTGSGILAIAARKLGAGRVVGCDSDPAALRTAAENARRNAVAIELTAAGAEAVTGPFDLVVANILAGTLIELAPALARKVAPGGALLLSGLLRGQEDEVLAAHRAAGLAPGETRRDGDWSLLILGRRR